LGQFFQWKLIVFIYMRTNSLRTMHNMIWPHLWYLARLWYGPLGLIFGELVLTLSRGKNCFRIKNKHRTKWEFKPKTRFVSKGSFTPRLHFYSCFLPNTSESMLVIQTMILHRGHGIKSSWNENQLKIGFDWNSIITFVIFLAWRDTSKNKNVYVSKNIRCNILIVE
jgi:hypothetical protein